MLCCEAALVNPKFSANLSKRDTRLCQRRKGLFEPLRPVASFAHLKVSYNCEKTAEALPVAMR